MNPTVPSIVPLGESDVSLVQAGGKGRSLSRLTAASLPVPSGFIIATDAYSEFIEVNNLKKPILEIVARVAKQECPAEEAAESIRSLIIAKEIPTHITEKIRHAYSELNSRDSSVAVRSSATAEDLPNLSFAGQQDTYLNVRGESALTEAVRNCWASLWTARAISYRDQKQIDHRDVEMAVVVQVMVPADIAGILFTANPGTGDRSEIVVNASYGLGESVVSGQVTPDTYVIDRNSFNVKQTVLGAKGKMLVSHDEQGIQVQTVAEESRNQSSLSNDLLVQLARLSLVVERLFEGVPQDIEWAVVDGECYLLQSRPITSLPVAPLSDVEWKTPSEGMKLIRRQVVENMPEPLSPLFEELYLESGLEEGMDILMSDLDLPFDLNDFLERPFFRTVNGYAYCLASYKSGWPMVRLIPKAIFWYLTNLSSFLKNMIPMWRDKGLPSYLETIERWRAVDFRSAKDEELISGIRSLATADAVYWFYISLVMGLAKIHDGMLHSFLSSRLVRAELTSGMFLRGFPSKTLEAQATLETVARKIDTTSALHELIVATKATELLSKLEQRADAESLLEDIRQYLDRNGHQIYNLDFVQPTQAEDPLPVLLSLQALLRDSNYDSGQLQSEMTKEREILVHQTLASLGPIRRWLFRKLLGWAQSSGPNREEALFYMGAAWPTLRHFALELGNRLTEAGTIAQPEDVFYLTSDELTEASQARGEGVAQPELGQSATDRRDLREARQRLHPPAMVPEKSRYKFGPIDMSVLETQKRNMADSDTLNGFAVSPGKITGIASVILSPSDFEKMQPNTILVCATTTPAWTPLFSQASGLVTDIGGMLAHGSIVAREYGIPAVMGTGNITQRIVSGQQIMVNGDTGSVVILD